MSALLQPSDEPDWQSPEIRQKLFRMALRQDFTLFVGKAFQTAAPGKPYHYNWHIRAIAYALERCARREITRLVITLPPRCLKSICASIAFPAWLLGRDPQTNIICISYAQELSDKLARESKAIIQTGWYESAFPRTRLKRDAVSDFVTTRGGSRLATSVGGGLTGRGGEFIIIDDPHKAADVMSDERRGAVHEWMGSTMLTRLNDQQEDVIIVIQQRLHEDDLAGRLIKAGWAHLNLPAIADDFQRIAIGPGLFHMRQPGDLLHPERLPRKILDALKLDMGGADFAAQYQQSPTPAGGNLVKWEWFQHYEVAPVRQPGDRIVLSWDTASKADQINDWSVCTVWLERDSRLHLLNVYRDRLEFPELLRRAASLAAEHEADAVLVEDKGSGTQLIQCLNVDRKFRVIRRDPQHDKTTRMHVQTPWIEAGNVLLPRHAAWLEEFKAEMLAFPGSRFDDQVDLVSQALEWFGEQRQRRPMRFT